MTDGASNARVEEARQVSQLASMREKLKLFESSRADNHRLVSEVVEYAQA